MRPAVLLRILSLCVASLGGCAEKGGPTSPEPLPGQATAQLENTLWRLVALSQRPVQAAPNLREARLVLVSENHRIQGDSGCDNRLSGSYLLRGESLTISLANLARHACAYSAKAVQEQIFLDTLRATTGYRIRGENLDLLDARGNFLARFESLYLR